MMMNMKETKKMNNEKMDYTENEQLEEQTLNDEEMDTEQKEEKEQSGKKTAIVVAGAVLCAALLFGGIACIGHRMHQKNLDQKLSDISAQISMTEDGLQEKVQDAVDAYIAEYGSRAILLSSMSDEDVEAMIDYLIGKMDSMEFSDGQKEVLLEVIRKALKDDPDLTVSSKVMLSDAAKDYISKSITEALENGGAADSVETIVERVLQKEGASGQTQYTFSDSDIDAIKKKIMSELSNGTQGTAGAKGEKGDKGDKGDTGATGKRGADGEDGYTPVKGKDYFTDYEIDNIESVITAALKNYISNDVTNFTNELKTSITKELERSSEELKKLISLHETLIQSNTSRLQSDESWIAALKVIIDQNTQLIEANKTEAENALEEAVQTLRGEMGEQKEDLQEQISAVDPKLASFSLTDNGDGTYTLNITDPVAE